MIDPNLAISAQNRPLIAIKVLHTVIWAFMVLCILALPILTARGQFRRAFLIMLPIVLETFVLIANGWRCPLTDIAGGYTADRAANFDIYLPEWLARRNKVIFGGLFAVNFLFATVAWLRSCR